MEKARANGNDKSNRRSFDYAALRSGWQVLRIDRVDWSEATATTTARRRGKSLHPTHRKNAMDGAPEDFGRA